MRNIRAFMEYPRQERPLRDVRERLQDYEDLHVLSSPEESRTQAMRCMNCGVPFCQSDFGCPLHNLIPEWNRLLSEGLEEQALVRLLMTAPFPEFTGRVCPALCEKACNLADSGVTNRDHELYLAETGFSRGWIRPRRPEVRTGMRIAVVGSGPAGLAAADLLNRAGHSVTVIERADRPGGLLMYGIPGMKLPKHIVERRIRLMEQEGVLFRTGTEGTPDTVREYSAVILCGGARKPRPLTFPGADASGVLYAVDYLSEATRALLEGRAPSADARGLHVIVVGGGDTGNDCAATALRQKCASVLQLEMMPAPPDARPAGNPWPEWPKVLRTDYGQQEAMLLQGRDPRIYETTVQSAETGPDGRIRSVRTVRVQSGPEGMKPVPGTEQSLPCDLLLIAAGFVGCDEPTSAAFGLAPDRRGRLGAADGSHRLRENLFTAGDMHTGQSLVVRALADGRKAAEEVNACLREKNRF